VRTVGSQTKTTTETTTNWLSRKLAPADRTLIFRLVGFYEYIKALQHLGALIEMCNESELRVIDEIIAEKDEFTVYTNLSRRLQRRPSTLSETGQSREDRFARRGLAWVMALARVEIGAMFAGFTNIRSPFEWVQPTQLEMSSYRTLLEDGMRTHYWSLANDPAFRKIARETPDHKTVAYVRRLTLARAFLEAAGKAGAVQLTPPQVAELRNWHSNLDTSRLALIASIELYLKSVQATSSKSTSNTSKIDWARACGRQLQAEKYELANGMATITSEKFGGN